ncbi:MAG: helix-turn-helix transcriptional regulator [Cyanobacteria bacterium P01_C01_bin.118]
MDQETTTWLTEVQSPPPPPPRSTSIGHEDDAFPPGLTPRETDILKLTIVGLDNLQIAQRLGTTRHNVEKYILRLQQKVTRYSQESPLNYILNNRD